MGNVPLFFEKFISKDSQYLKEVSKWGVGKGKGKLTLQDLFALEDDDQNLFFNVSDIPEGYVISDFIPTEGDTSYKLKVNRIQDGVTTTQS
ncbi:hypothetical protein PP175_26295 (plasmid) [Aneurinibacillus sp. Ricciae_BoGa-3]|uniref:hypothetical protein n=1 Tax=Aneurinibacillus sp. Ricciae_BoGa-3 TaxID=3022697 RepID=UPI002341BE12|nr:hypothetical protein [Aneurinibacillus sp. Ricciae_BoGa-3]WCK57578.1 hypothetical protein PP175_26295 [Aneurinibacillus sp. Ricciae_BoGa-3]